MRLLFILDAVEAPAAANPRLGRRDSVCPNEVEAHVRIMEPVIRYLCVRQDA